MSIHLPTRTLHFAILECLRLSDDISRIRGQFGDIFRMWLEASAKAYNDSIASEERLDSRQVVVQTQSFDVCNGHYPKDTGVFDALIVTGSTASTYDDDPWVAELKTYLQGVYANEPSVKIFGGCFGHQLLSQTLLGKINGTRVERSPQGWEIGVHEVNLDPDFIADFPRVLTKERNGLACQFLHADHVVLGNEGQLPLGWMTIGSTKLCAVQGIYQRGRVLTYQGHPEFDAFLNERAVRNLGKNGVLADEQVTELVPLIHQQDDAVSFGEILIDFVLHQSI